MNKEKLKVEARKVERAVRLAFENGGIHRLLAIDVNNLIHCIDNLDEQEVEQSDKQTRELEFYNDELIRDNNQLRNALNNQEVLSQEWIDENKVARIDNLRKMTASDVVSVEKLKNVIVPKYDKPIIPQFVANYIEKWKYEGITMQEWFTLDCDNVNDEDYLVFKWLQDKNSEENNKGDYLLINSIRYGYEVEETQ